MREKTAEELLQRAELALSDGTYIEYVETQKTPSALQKTLRWKVFPDMQYSLWALAALKRDYPEIYNNLPIIQDLKNKNTTASLKSNAEGRKL